MADQSRPNPDHLLAQVQAASNHRGRGRLRVFLGYAAGVGKTFAMLHSAHEQLAKGSDLVVAYVETHRRKETEALLAGLEVLPRRSVEYRGTTLEELDLEQILDRHPQIALVDELAHTNAPGARHLKRFQDVLELLDAGIDVYTTLNIQHLESLNDLVAQITGVRVKETVPDSILEQADETEVVDLPPEELLIRLRDGKVYIPEQARQAVSKFFRQGNLTALREMVLRRAASQVDGDMRAYMQLRSITGPWPVGERLLVCVSPSPTSEQLVRGTKRLATELGAEWFAVHIDTPNQPALSEAAEVRLASNMRLAESLGARTARLPASTTASGIVRFAQDHNVTKLIVGKPILPSWNPLLHSSLVEGIIRQSGPIDVYFLGGASPPLPSKERDPKTAHRLALAPYFWSLLLVVLATLLSLPISRFLSPTNLVMVYLVAVVSAAVSLGRGPAFFASVLSVAAFDFFFIKPRFAFSVEDTEYLITFAGLLVVGLVISTLAAHLKSQLEVGRRREAETTALYSLSKELAVAVELEDLLQAVLNHVLDIFDTKALVLVPDADQLRVVASNLEAPLDEDEAAVAAWVYNHKQSAGAGTDTLSASSLHHLPLSTAKGTVGVLALELPHPWTPEQERTLGSIASQAALAIERVHLAEESQQLEVLRATEQMQAALLNSVSHELRTPLASITGVLSALGAESGSEASVLPVESQTELLQAAWEQVEHLNWLVGNLLDMTRLEAKAVKLKLELCDLQDIVGVCLSQLKRRLANHPVVTELPDSLPQVPVDFVLIVQVINNLLDNAARYSPPGSPIELKAALCEEPVNCVKLVVADHGPGLGEEDRKRLFDGLQPTQGRGYKVGAGLGLSICKAIVELHGGSIQATNRAEGGSEFSFILPLSRDLPSATEETL